MVFDLQIALFSTMNKTRRHLASYTIAGTDVVVKRGDCVLMGASDPEKPWFIGKIELMEEDELHEVKVTVSRYYWPEESVGGWREHHGHKEIFLSDEYVTQNALTIQKKCDVHSIDNYVKLNPVAAKDFICRFEYNTSTCTFNPDTVDQCFNCKKPYNPDNFMLQCVTCKDRFHPGCVSISEEVAKNLKQFKCSKCLAPPEFIAQA